jgi:hypothetical protein
LTSGEPAFGFEEWPSARCAGRAGTVDTFGMSETTLEEVEADRYRDWKSLEAELQEIARSKVEPSPSPGYWAKRRNKN